MPPTSFFTAPYLHQKSNWPTQGRHILAHYDETSIIVYQAYRPAIGHFAAQHGSFGGEWSFDRMSWIKPNFLWMMYRCGWGTKAGQEVTLAIRLKRDFFERVLERVVFSAYDPEQHETLEAWKQAGAASDVRLQWDPDHAPSGGPVERRAVQLGLRGALLKEYAHEAILSIEDISDFVAAQRPYATPTQYDQLMIPAERVYLPAKPEVRQKLKLSEGTFLKT